MKKLLEASSWPVTILRVNYTPVFLSFHQPFYLILHLSTLRGPPAERVFLLFSKHKSECPDIILQDILKKTLDH